MSKNKGEILKALLAKNEDLFRCPLCSGRMKLVHLKSLICTNNHCFDLSKQGYINMLSHAQRTKYDRQMFEFRRTICRSGFYETLNTKICEIIINKLESQSEPIKILDAGCGEGSHLSRIQEKITQSSGTGHLGVGLDISKEGIFLASKEYPNTIWCVGDLAKTPFASQQFNIILNILAPANYTEFKRMIAHDGRVIKVIPARDYLLELRNIFYEQTDQQIYSNDNTLDLFRSKFKLMNVERVRYNITLDQTLIEPLIHMTPLSWGTTKEHLQKALEMNLREVTIDLTILAGKN
jgi:23S rRNA (guanine745-N1)-methyltransferase